MALYYYTAKDSQGNTKSDKLEAASQSDLARILKEQGFYLLSVQELGAEGPKKSFLKKDLSLDALLFWRGVPLVEKLVFVRNLAVTIKAGLSLTRSIDALSEQTTSSKFRSILTNVNADVAKGSTFADSLAKYPREFSDLFVNMVRAGEASGTLEETLVVLYRQLKKDYDLRRKIKGALIYPAVIVGAMVIIGALMMIYVVPSLAQTFRELNVDLPASTRFVIWFAENLGRLWPFLLAGLAAFFLLMRHLIKKTRLGKRTADMILLKAPLFGPLVKKINSARFARTLSSLIESGMPILKALEITSRTLSNIYYQESIAGAQEVVQKGGQLSEVLKQKRNLYLPMVVQMVAIGEETGALASLLKRIAIFFEAEVADSTKNLSTIIEPVLMVVIGAAVGFFAVSMIQPMYSLVGSI
ncbi:type II secretion system F family protein [Candidatus Parcubacteria bacterium]|nr:MAG: type II secretion system F family protein [Candidatus Parcubacteria bacterium]